MKLELREPTEDLRDSYRSLIGELEDRGEPGTDAAQRALAVTTERMRKRLVEVVSGLVGEKGLLIIGGTPEMVSAAARGVPKKLNGRVAERPSLHVEISTPEARDAVEAAASELSHQIQAQHVCQMVDQARAKGLGCLGREATERAPVERRVDTLVLARSFIDTGPDFADHCIGTAFEQHADVEEVSGEAGDRLVAEGGGIGARLRYRVSWKQDQGQKSGRGRLSRPGSDPGSPRQTPPPPLPTRARPLARRGCAPVAR